MDRYDFSGWATRNDLVCSDGRTIRRDAFKHCDGMTVPLVWNHQQNDPNNVLGHALLENRKDGVYAYCSFNDSDSGQAAKMLVQHGDIDSLSIYANGLKQQGGNVMHGDIREVSLVIAGANPGAFIDFVDMAHSADGEDGAIISVDEPIYFAHADNSGNDEDDDNETVADVFNSLSEKQKTVVYAMIGAAVEQTKAEAEEEKKPVQHSATSDDDASSDDETVGDVFNTLTEKQKTVVYALIGAAIEEANGDDDEDDTTDDTKGGTKNMKHNVFDKQDERDDVLIHSEDQGEILDMARMKTVGSLQNAFKVYAEQHSDVLRHGYEDIEQLFPDPHDVRPGAPDLVTNDQGWVSTVMSKVHKSPYSRIRTRAVDARIDTLRAYGYKKTKEKKALGNVKLIKRTTDPQTIYVRDALQRDDILDITDFDVVTYQWGIMRGLLNEEIATAILVGDGRDDGDEDKITEDHIRSIWNDDEFYTIHQDVDLETAAKNLNGTGTSANFGENYIKSEAIIAAALEAREDYRGTGTPDFFCSPYTLNTMLLAKDLNGRRIYASKTDVAAALNVRDIYTVEDFDSLVRTDKEQKKHNLLGIIVNLADYTLGSAKGGEITRFNQFDIDFNAEKYLIETRLSGALTRVSSAIVLEEKPVNP